MSKAPDELMQLRRDRLFGKALKALDQRMREAVRPVTALQDRLALDLIQKCTDFMRRQVLMVQPLNEVGNGLVKVNIVFPERVVGVNEQGLGDGDWRHC